jgi:DNA-binding MarR family transcriptional regulator
MFALLGAAHALEQQIETALGGTGLSLAKFGVLSELVTEGGLTLGEIAARIKCVRSNVTQLVDRLEVDGLVRRVADPLDRRSIRAELTALGKQRQAAGATTVDRLQREFLATLGGENRKALERALAALR